MPSHTKGNSRGPTELLVVEADAFPSAVIVELWHRDARGKREFLDSRRYEVVEEVEARLANVDPEA